MDWTKLFYLNLAILYTISAKADSPKNRNTTKEENFNSNFKSLNSTADTKETLEESPSEIIRFQNPVIFRENHKNYEIISSTRKEKHQESRSAKDLSKEANIYSAVITFTETPLPGHWQIIPEVIPYERNNPFLSPLPIIESQSFVNNPEISTKEINYSPGSFEGRNVNPNSEYPEDYSSSEASRYPESDHHPGRGHIVHTETTHDYGKFLPADYKSKIEKEAETLIKQKKAQNSTLGSGRQPSIRDNQQYVHEYRNEYQKPANTAFFHKGSFEDAYPFPATKNNQHDQRYMYTSEEYPRQPRTFKPKSPVSSIAVGESYGPKQQDTSTETYPTQYSYPVERPPQHNYAYRENSHHGSSHLRGPLNGLPQIQHSYTSPQSGEAYHGNVHHENPVHRDPHYRNLRHGSQHDSDRKKSRQYELAHHSVPQDNAHIPRNPQQNYPYRDQYQEKLQPTDLPPPEYHHTSLANRPRQHDLSTEKYDPTYPNVSHRPLLFNSDTNPLPPKQYGPPEQMPGYQPEEKFTSSFSPNYNPQVYYTNPPPKEFQNSYSNNPENPPPSATDSSQYKKDSALDLPTRAKNPEEVAKEKAYFNTFKSLVDLYRNYGFQPFNLNEIPIILPPRFSHANPLNGKIEVSGPTTGSTENFTPHSKHLNYPENTNVPRDQNFGSYREPYPSRDFNSHENVPGTTQYEQASFERNKNFQYPEHLPYDSNPDPVVSTEHSDISDIPRPDTYSTQVESPKETYVEGGSNYNSPVDPHPILDVPAQGIRIKDYDSKTFYGDPHQKTLDGSPESEYGYSASVPDAPLHTHSAVRSNPYQTQNSHSEEVTTYRPRVYRQKLIIENDPSIADSEEKASNFYSGEKTSKFRSPNSIDNSGDNFNTLSAANNGNQPNEYSGPQTPEAVNEYQEWGHDTMKKSNGNKREKSRSSHNKRKPTQNSRKVPYQDEISYKEPEQRSKSGHTEISEGRSKRHRKRSSQKSPKKHKPRDHMRAEGSTYHWGMERHKETDGFFQYANVPGAKAFEYGYRMGGPEHTRERHHKTKGVQSKIKVNWEDGNGDSGDHYWEFNHNSKEDDTEEKKSKEKKVTKSEKMDSEDSEE